ncbi:MAG: chromosome partitioning protein ParB, partial [Crocinitomicaceae bacterium]|nr:chromosome partitioning protein ParB [Crocinitomicaceae bacterium]
IEISLSFQRLIDECQLTQEQLSDKVGKQRSTVSNYLRLLKLPLEIQAALRDNKISMGHARSLLSISNEAEQLETLQSILADNLSVRKVEELVKRKTSPKKRSESIELNRSEKKEVQQLSNVLETKVKVAMNNRGKGKIVIDFKNDSEFNRIMKLLNE